MDHYFIGGTSFLHPLNPDFPLETFEKCHFEERKPAPDVISKERKRLRNLVNIGTGTDMDSRFLTPLTRGFEMTEKRVEMTRSEGGEAEDRIQKSEVRSQKSGGRRQETGDRKLNNTVIPAGF
ncbi:MAG: hypothetical protein KBH82_05955 [Syntrophorhabdaceae bacterium]|nr:hypothetical protein [Syntrophorhabdaceae bacterium]MDI9560176.1 hypothetical protein [Pseudomonadota bacterium]